MSEKSKTISYVKDNRKRCNKCGGLLELGYEKDKCLECKKKKRNTILGVALAIACGLYGLVKYCGRNSENELQEDEHDEIGEGDEAKDNAPVFYGISEEKLTEIARYSNRGVKAKVLDDKHALFYYTSARGKENAYPPSRVTVDENGLVQCSGFPGPYYSSVGPDSFRKNVQVELDRLKEE